MKILIFGEKGWIGQKIIHYLELNSYDYILANHYIHNEKDINNLLKYYNPTHVLCLIGKTHGKDENSIDYLEDKLYENIKSNLYIPLILALSCKKYNIHLTYFGTGCIFNRDDPLTYSYKESDIPDFFGSSYSIVKGFTDQIFHHSIFDNVLNLRIRMPITNDSSNRNFIIKLLNYKKICSMNNSMTVLDDFIPIIIDLMNKNYKGTINMVNPGYINHNEILELYKNIVDNDLEWENFTIEEQNKILKSKRSNNILDTSLIESLYPKLKNIKISIKNQINKFYINK